MSGLNGFLCQVGASHPGISRAESAQTYQSRYGDPGSMAASRKNGCSEDVWFSTRS